MFSSFFIYIKRKERKEKKNEVRKEKKNNKKNKQTKEPPMLYNFIVRNRNSQYTTTEHFHGADEHVLLYFVRRAEGKHIC